MGDGQPHLAGLLVRLDHLARGAMTDRYDSRGWIVRRKLGEKPEPIAIPGPVPDIVWWFGDQFGEGVAVAGMSLSRCMARAESEIALMSRSEVN